MTFHSILELLQLFVAEHRRKLALAGAALLGLVLLLGVALVAHGQVRKAEARETFRHEIHDTFALCVRGALPNEIDVCTMRARQARTRLFGQLVG